MKKMNLVGLISFVTIGFVGVANATSYKINKELSEVSWKGEKKIVNDNHVGTIEIQSGMFTWKDGMIESGEVVIDMKTISTTDLTGDKKSNLEGHLKSEDFFDVAKFETAMFKVTSVKKIKENEFEVTGDLTIKGKTHPNTFMMKTEMKDGKIHGQGNMVFNRAKYDVKYASESFFDVKKLGDKIIKDEIMLKLNVVAEK